jgi:hypothetical protein
VHFALKRPDLAEPFRQYLKTVFDREAAEASVAAVKR